MPLTLLHRIDTASPDETAAVARGLSTLLRAGDCVLLDGPIGAGKTHFARATICAAQGCTPEDIPSPTFTLVQTYDTDRGEIWHADLYRLDNVQEVIELGLEDAFDTAICLVEWPDRMGDLAPVGALSITFAITGDDSRALTFSGDAAWGDRLISIAHPATAGV